MGKKKEVKDDQEIADEHKKDPNEPPSKRKKTSPESVTKEKEKKETESEQELELEEVAADFQDNETADVSTVQGSTIAQLKQIKDKKPFTDSEAEQVLAEWMEKQNRPFSVQNLLDNFQHQLKRAQCMRTMDQLTTSQILTCKEYGKAKVYLINQDCFPETNTEQLKVLDEQIQVRKEELDELQTNLTNQKNYLKEAGAGASNANMSFELESVKKEIEMLKNQIKPFQQSGAAMLTENDLQKAEGDLKKWQMEWKKRKRGCMDCMGTISESMEMNRKDFQKKIGLETDEECRIVCPI